MDVSSSSTGPIRDFLKSQSLDQPNRVVHMGPGRTYSKPDEAIISDRGIDLAKVKDAVRSAPDVREEKVAALRDSVAQGTYQMSPIEIARAILAARTK